MIKSIWLVSSPLFNSHTFHVLGNSKYKCTSLCIPVGLNVQIIDSRIYFVIKLENDIATFIDPSLLSIDSATCRSL